MNRRGKCFHQIIPFAILVFDLQAADINSVTTFFQNSDNSKLTSITAISVATVNSNLKSYKLTSDVALGSGGGSTFVNGEILTTGGFKAIAGKMSDQVSKLSMKSGASPQLEYVETLKESQADSTAVLTTKKNLQLASATAYAAAANAAFVLKKAEKTAFESCTGTIVAAVKACEPVESTANDLDKALDDLIAARESEAPSVAGLSSTKAAKSQVQTKIESLKSKLQEEATSFDNQAERAMKQQKITEAQEYKAKSNACKEAISPLSQCSSLGKLLDENESYGNTVVITQTLKIINKSFFKTLFEAFLPTAEAEAMSSIFGMGAESVGAFGSISSSLGAKVDGFILSPKKRAMIWGTMAKLSNVAADSTQVMIDQVENNSIKTNLLIDKIKSTNIPFYKKFLKNLANTANAEITANKNKINLEIKHKLPCLAGNSGNSTCKSLTTAMVELPSFKKMPNDLKKTSIQITQLSDSIQDAKSYSPVLMKEVSAVAAKSKTLNKLLIDQQNAENREAKKEGRKIANYNRETDGFIENLNAICAKVLSVKKISPTQFLASFGGTEFSLKKAVVKTIKKLQEKIGLPVNVGESEASTQKEIHKNHELNEETSKNYMNKKYKLGTADINTNSDVSIFNIISNRYQKYQENNEKEEPKK